MALIMALIVFVGFAPTFFLSPWIEPARPVFLAPVILVHGAIFTLWIILLVVQPMLIVADHRRLHRVFGWSGVVLIAAVLVSGVAAGLESAIRPTIGGRPPKGPQFLGVILFGPLMFAVLAGFAVAYRRKAEYHKRLMYLATINLLQAAIVRLPLSLPGDFGPSKTFLYACLLVVPLLAWDLAARRRIHAATLWGGLAVVAAVPFRFWFSGTDLWLGLAERAVDAWR